MKDFWHRSSEIFAMSQFDMKPYTIGIMLIVTLEENNYDKTIRNGLEKHNVL